MNERISALLAKRWVLPTITGVVGAGVGAFVGYKFTKAQYDDIEAKIEEIEKVNDQLEFDFSEVASLQRDLEVATRRLSVLERHPSYSHEHQIPMTPDEVDVLQEKRTTQRSKPVRVDLSPLDEVEEKGKAVVSNIFGKRDDNAGDEWDYKTEIESRDKRKPYIIHVDEYVADEMGWGSQSTITWYEADQVLCDSHDTPIYNHNEVVGELRFGHGSNDANVVYIRNEELQHEFEVLRDEGSYEEIVLGETMEREVQKQELKHSHQMRFRDD